MIPSPLRYPGGKNRAVKIISKLVPKFDEFREPFVGGGSVFSYFRQAMPNRIFWINDLYFELYIFWEAVKENISGVVEQVAEWRKNFESGKELHKFLQNGRENFTPTQIAAAFFVLNRITFSGTTLSGGFSELAFKGRFTDSSIKRLLDISSIMDGVEVTNFDYGDVISAPPRSKNGEVFIFLDPPYYSATKSALYGKNGHLHKSFDHERFAGEMKNCSYKWLITYDDSPYIRDLFSFAHIVPWNLTYGMRNVTEQSDQTGKELFISNYELGFETSRNKQMSFCF